ncbi:Nif3-like dinuclear metal center hexameric protein [Hippea jasoniae]|uniref:Nif3-like dinuclear metal center hexameric protein n=1 Tax=Hippea jasoniae TaxID=944479 RepID=UPI00068ED8F0|nr:Nif3-like dinuclear metal center hexameric protein [Hippea jasoniae]
MEVGKLIEFLQAYFPLSLQEGWDNSGLQISPQESSIKGVLLALDITSATIDEAIRLGCNVVIAHHPLIFSSTKKIYNDFYPFNVAYRAIQAGIGIYAFHTNLDIAENGLNDYLCKKLRLEDVEIIEYAKPLRIGRLNQPKSFEDFLEYVKEKLEVEVLKYVKAKDKMIERVAVCSGSCMDLLNQIRQLDFDVFLSGDLKHHTAIFAKETGINVVDATHFHTEKYAKFILKDLIEANFKDIRVFVSKEDRLPWKYF